MHIHKPKVARSVREFLSEIGIIVVGILIALTGEQFVEAISWHHKVEATEAAIKTEMGDNLRFARRVQRLDSCAMRFMDALQAAIITNDTTTVRKLDSVRDAPFPAAPWSSGTFTAAMGSQVEDHLPDGRMAAYSREFTWIPLQMEFQNKLFDELVASTTARFGLPQSPETLDRQLAAVDEARSYERGRLDIADAMLRYANAKLALAPPDSAVDQAMGARAKACEAQIEAIAAAAKRAGNQPR